MKQKHLVIFSAFFLLIAFVAGAMLYSSQKSDQALEAYRRDKSTFIRENVPTFGNPAAKVDIVEFLDPACGTCKEFHPLVKKLMAAHPDKIRLYVRYAAFHQGSDQVIKILEAAHRQGKFQETLEALFAAQDGWVRQHRAQAELVWNFIGGVGLDIIKLRQDMSLPEMDKIVAQGLADAKTLKVKATPEFFVNGRPLPSFGFDQLKSLVNEAVAAAY
ncbi:MAG: thioredoxin domain-containing protein [Pseudomonadota bacterium]